ATASHQLENQLFSGAFDGKTPLDDRIEHGAEAAPADDAAHGGDDDVIHRQRVKLDQRFAAVGRFGCGSFDEPAHARDPKRVRYADAAHARALLFKKSIEHASNIVRGNCAFESQFAEGG